MIQYQTISSLSGPFLITPGDLSLEEAQDNATKIPIHITGYRREKVDLTFNEVITQAEFLDEGASIIPFREQFPTIIQHQDISQSKIFAIEVIPVGIILNFAVGDNVERVQINRFGNKIRAAVPIRPRRKSKHTKTTSDELISFSDKFHLAILDFHWEYLTETGPSVIIHQVSENEAPTYQVSWHDPYYPESGIDLHITHNISLIE